MEDQKMAQQVRAAEDTLRDIKNWVAIFAKEHNLSGEAQQKLHCKLDELAQRIGAIECK